MTDATPPDPSVLRLERTFNASAETVLDAWLSPEVLRRWWPAGARDEESKRSHREGWEASFDNLERVFAK